MNDQTAIASYIFAAFVALVIGVAIRRMVVGWRRRGAPGTVDQSIAGAAGHFGAATIAPTHGLYVGSTLASNRLERIVAGDFGYRAKAILTRYPQGGFCFSGRARDRSGCRASRSPRFARSVSSRAKRFQAEAKRRSGARRTGDPLAPAVGHRDRHRLSRRRPS